MPSSRVGVAESRFGFPGPGTGVGEALLQAVPLLAGEQRGVLGRDDAPDGGVPVQAAEPGGRLGGAALVGRLYAEVQAGHAEPEVPPPVPGPPACAATPRSAGPPGAR